MSGKEDFNDAFRRAVRHDPTPGDPVSPPPAEPARPQPIDAGAGTGGNQTRPPEFSMNDFIRRASRDRE